MANIFVHCGLPGILGLGCIHADEPDSLRMPVLPDQDRTGVLDSIRDGLAIAQDCQTGLVAKNRKPELNP